MNVYLDIDGVLLFNTSGSLAPSVGAVELLKYITENHDVYWLTTHCHGGENRAPEYLKQYFPEPSHPYIDKIKPTDWNTWKTDAIDFSQDFIWLDDNVYSAEQQVLENHNAQSKLILVNLKEHPDQLKQMLSQLQ